ncbi:hypothetical protein TMatcc_009132 [Talaromyces marneffei ATCC 18224]
MPIFISEMHEPAQFIGGELASGAHPYRWLSIDESQLCWELDVLFESGLRWTRCCTSRFQDQSRMSRKASCKP